MTDQNVEVVQRFEDAFVRGDMEEVLSLVAEDIVVHEAPSLPYPGEHRGHDGFLALADAFNRVWELTSPLDLTLLDAGDSRVVALVRFDVVARATGKPLTLELAEIYTVHDGRIADLDIYYRDTAAIAAATDGGEGPVMIDVDLRTRPAAVRLVEPDDFRAFKIVARGPEAELEPAVEAFGRMTDDGYVFVDIAALRQLAGERGRDGAWLESLDAMVEYARAHGWTDGTDAIRGHVQRND